MLLIYRVMTIIHVKLFKIFHQKEETRRYGFCLCSKDPLVHRLYIKFQKNQHTNLKSLDSPPNTKNFINLKKNITSPWGVDGIFTVLTGSRGEETSNSPPVRWRLSHHYNECSVMAWLTPNFYYSNSGGGVPLIGEEWFGRLTVWLTCNNILSPPLLPVILSSSYLLLLPGLSDFPSSPIIRISLMTTSRQDLLNKPLVYLTVL